VGVPWWSLSSQSGDRETTLDSDGGVAGWLGDYEDATFAERPTEDEQDDKEEPEPSAKAFLGMLESA
jgi:hypothetical protein